MEAKDTVMGERELARAFRSSGDELVASNWDLHSEDDLINVAQVQAEISFKAGIREVVEWVKAHEDTIWGRTILVHFIAPETEWEAKLKEWGL